MALNSESEPIKDWYTTAELALMTGRSEHTVREWCREKKISAEVVKDEIAGHGEWRISRAELERFRSMGLNPS